MGNKSMITNISLSPDNKYLAISDKDEKIRITSYPNTYNIITYCFGHTESISCLEWISTKEISN
jgi:tRNA (guanine-N(7)-)-methyltransferase subunit TRM82